tara:strand:- start:340 stop:915 length:576 start_codon:yes stop_codon:yes gene_type:complete
MNKEKCPICLEDFNTDEPDKIPYRLCDNCHFTCTSCTVPFIRSHYTNYNNLSITTNISDSAIKLVCKYYSVEQNMLQPSIQCPTCRIPINCNLRKRTINDQTIKIKNTYKFNRCRYFEEKIDNPPIDKTLRERADMEKIEELRLMIKKKDEINIELRKLLKNKIKSKYNSGYDLKYYQKEIIQSMGRSIRN